MSGQQEPATDNDNNQTTTAHTVTKEMMRFNVAILTCLFMEPIKSFSPSSSSSSPQISQMSAAALPKSIIIIGGGIQGTSVAYHLSKKLLEKQQPNKTPYPVSITILEAKEPASAASGKGGGFMARSWGDGSPTQSLHHLAFDLYEELAVELGCKSYRKLPVLSVSPAAGSGSTMNAALQKARESLGDIMPDWLDGNMGRIGVMGQGDDTAQITPKEFVEKMIEKSCSDGLVQDVILGECIGVDAVSREDGGSGYVVKGVKYIDRQSKQECFMEADVVVVSAGPWSCQAEDWFDNAVELPMEGVKSTSIVWKQREGQTTDATALFCGEDYRYGTHLEVYPRPDDSIYICGIGGSDYIAKEELKVGAYREECNANESRVEAASNAFREISETYKKNGELQRVQACMRPCPPDAMPYMGKIPGYEGAYINAGHNCWGIAWAPACGIAMSELILEGKSSSIDLKPFDPTRFTQRVTGRGRKRRGENVGEQW